MATSGSYDYNINRTKIIERAYELLGIKDPGEDLSYEDSAFAVDMLNMLVKNWDARGIHLWTFTEGTLFLEYGVAKYDLSNASGSAKFSTDVVETTLTAAASASATELTVTSTTGMTAADTIGIVTSDNTTHWSTIASVDDATTVTIDDGLDSAAASGGYVYSFTSRIHRPLKVYSVRRRTGTANDIELTKLARMDYFNLPTKTTTGTPNQYYYDPQISTGEFYVWPTPGDTNTRLKVTFARQIQDFDTATDEPDLPQEWLLPLVYNLALVVAPAFGKEEKAMKMIGPLANKYLEETVVFDNELASVIFKSEDY